MADVFANSRSILHKGDGNQHVAAPPDVCKTPSPGGPVPIPYPNMAMDSSLADGTKKVTINGKPVAHEKSNLSMSTGDEPGTAGGGIISSKFKGKMTWNGSSTDVKVEGKGVVRFMDPTGHNNNSYNTAFICMGEANTGYAYADDFFGRCVICGTGPRTHRIFETENSVKYCKAVIDALTRSYNSPMSISQRKKWGNGFMVGVMICKCETPKVWVTKSGKALPAFTAAAKVDGVHEVITDNDVDVGSLVEANMSTLASTWWKTDRIQYAWDKLVHASEGPGRKPGFNPPGACAAMKLLAKAKGHAPREMTEMFFDPRAGTPDQWNPSYYYIRRDEAMVGRRFGKQRAILQNQRSQFREKKFLAGETVVSCHTCQFLLYMTNCPVRKCP